jgi:hypothetical protein
VNPKKRNPWIGHRIDQGVAELASGLAKDVVLTSKGNDASLGTVAKLSSNAV